MAYLTSLKTKGVLLLSYNIINKILNKLPSYFDRTDIHSFKFIAGPHCINENHWCAFIVNIEAKRFYMIDPKKNKQLSEESFDSWVSYYNQHYESKATVWQNMNVDHPVQKDNYNCGVFTSLFIEQIIKKGEIDFETVNMQLHRVHMASNITAVSTSVNN